MCPIAASTSRTTTDAGSGSDAGYDIGQIQSGQYMEYTIAPNLVALQLVCGFSNVNGGSVQVLFDGTDRTGVVAIPNTGGVWQDLDLSVVMQNPVQAMGRGRPQWRLEP